MSDENGPDKPDPSADDGVIGKIAPTDGAPPPQTPDESSQRGRRGRPLATTLLLAGLGALLGALLAILWSLGIIGGGDPADTAPVVVDERPPVLDVSAGDPTERILFAPVPERPDVTPDIITAESPTVYCFYEHSRLPADVSLTAHWFHEGSELGELELRDLKTGAAAMADDGPDPTHAAGRFAIPAPEGGFASGVYEVELSAPDHGELTWRGSFFALPRAAKILEGGGETDEPLVITALATALEVNDDGSPTDPVNEFAAEAPRIYACFRYTGMAAGGSLTVRWYGGDVELESARSELPVATADGWGQAWLDRPGDEFPVGDCRVTVHLGEDDQALASVGFSIVDVAEGGAPADG